MSLKDNPSIKQSLEKLKKANENLNENLKKEQRGIYNVTFNEKKATPIKTAIQTDLEVIEEAIINEVTMYVKGYHNPNTSGGRGSNHIKHHLEKGSKGEISLEELLNLGNALREYLKIFQEPFINKKGGKVFEWENDKGVRFRVVVDEKRADMGSSDNCTTAHTLTNQGTNATSIADEIITFYSDRNFKKMEFKNPKVKAYYDNQNNENLENSNQETNTIKRRNQK